MACDGNGIHRPSGNNISMLTESFLLGHVCDGWEIKKIRKNVRKSEKRGCFTILADMLLVDGWIDIAVVIISN